MPAAVVLAIQLAQGLLAEFPQVAGLAGEIKDFFTNLVSSGQISIDQQNAIHAHVDAVCAAVLAGTEPPEFSVEADPTA